MREIEELREVVTSLKSKALKTDELSKRTLDLEKRIASAEESIKSLLSKLEAFEKRSEEKLETLSSSIKDLENLRKSVKILEESLKNQSTNFNSFSAKVDEKISNLSADIGKIKLFPKEFGERLEKIASKLDLLHEKVKINENSIKRLEENLVPEKYAVLVKQAVGKIFEKEIESIKKKLASLETEKIDLDKIKEWADKAEAFKAELSSLKNISEENSKKVNEITTYLENVRNVSNEIAEIKKGLSEVAEKLQKIAEIEAELSKVKEGIKNEVSSQISESLKKGKEEIEALTENLKAELEEVKSLREKLVEKVEMISDEIDKKVSKVNSSFASFKSDLEKSVDEKISKISKNVEKNMVSVEGLKKDVEKLKRLKGIEIGRKIHEVEEKIKSVSPALEEVSNIRKDVESLKRIKEDMEKSISDVVERKVSDTLAPEIEKINKLTADTKAKLEEIEKIGNAFIKRAEKVSGEIDEKISKINESFSIFEKELVGVKRKVSSLKLQKIDEKKVVASVKEDLEKKFFAEVSKHLLLFQKRIEEDRKVIEGFLKKSIGNIEKRVKSDLEKELIDKNVTEVNKSMKSLEKMLVNQLNELVAEYEKRFNILRENIEETAKSESSKVDAKLSKVLSQQLKQIEELENKIASLRKELEKTNLELSKTREGSEKMIESLRSSFNEVIAEYEKRFEIIKRKIGV
jgi:chromosome segregation ATPase